jgi:hypothetical protein
MVSPMEVLVDLEIPREFTAHESLCVHALSDNVELVKTPPSSRNSRDELEDEGEKWIEVIRKSRGKHPKKRLQC